ncbi:hypothetical protein ABK040_012277 [Willaertia magna]
MELDGIAYYTIFEYLSITSYHSILLVNKEWNEHLNNLYKFKKNKEICLEITNYYQKEVEIKKYINNNYDVLLYLLKLNKFYQFWKTRLFKLCNSSFRESKEVIYRSLINNNGINIYHLLKSDKLLKDKDILQRICVFNEEFYTKMFCKNDLSENDWLDYNFCLNFLNIYKEYKTEINAEYLLSQIKNKQSVIDFLNLNSENKNNILKILLFLNKEIILKDEFILTKIIESKISNQLLNNYLQNNLDIFNHLSKNILNQFIFKKNFLITLLYNKFTKDELIDICASKIFLFKILQKVYNFLLQDIKKEFIKKNIKGFKVLSKNGRSILINRNLVENVIERDCEMIYYVSDLTLNDFNNLVLKNNDLNRFKNKLLFKKEYNLHNKQITLK